MAVMVCRRVAWGWLWLWALTCSLAASAQSWRIDAWTSRAGLPSDSLNMVLPLRDGHLLVTSFYEPPTIFDGHSFAPLRLQGDADVNLLRGASVAAQTRDGALWFATRERGLVRVAIDGTIRAVALDDDASPADIRTLMLGPQGGLYIGTARGLYHLPDPTSITGIEGPTRPEERQPVTALLEDRSGRLWIGHDRGLSWREAGRYGKVAQERLDTWIWSLHQDRTGVLWVGTRGSGLARHDGSSWRYYDRSNGFPNDVVRQAVDAEDGVLWVATSGGGLARLREGELVDVVNTARGLQGDTFYWLHVDAAGAVWAAGPGTGLNRIRPSAFSRWAGLDGMASAFAWSLHEDQSGAIWVGTNAGVSRWSGTRGELIGAAGPGYRAVTRAFLQDGEDLLVATEGGLFRWRAGAFRLVDGTADLQVWALTRDDHDRIWAGGDRLWRIDGDRATSVDPSPRDGNRRIVALHSLSGGALLILTQRSGVTVLRDGVETPLIGPEVGALRALWIDPDGRYWLAGERLQWLDESGQAHVLSGFMESYGRGLHALLPDQLGNLWVPGNVGLFRFSVAELRQHAKGLAPEPLPQRFELNDGLTSTEFNGGGQSPAIRDRTGRLWFATTNGVTRVDPELLEQRSLPLTVVVSGVETDQGWSPARLARTLPAGTRRVDLHYTALPAAIGGDARFAYRLEPLINDWVEVGSQRRALFPGLGPGRYRFQVRASIPGSGVPAELATQEFEIAPRWIERGWVRAMLLGLALAAASILPLAHIRALRRQRRRLLDDVADKTRALEKLAATDALTGLANRRTFDARLDRALADARRPALLLIDVDHFKRYNDALGHQAGDACLSRLGQLLQTVVRHADDLAARLGGEEFALLLADADAHTAEAIAARIHDQLTSAALPHPDSPVSAHLTVSIGHAIARADEAAVSLYRRADDALYRAKAAGRNRSVDAG